MGREEILTNLAQLIWIFEDLIAKEDWNEYTENHNAKTEKPT